MDPLSLKKPLIGGCIIGVLFGFLSTIPNLTPQSPDYGNTPFLFGLVVGGALWGTFSGAVCGIIYRRIKYGRWGYYS